MNPLNRDEVGKEVRNFYGGCSFRGYEEFETPVGLVEKAQRLCERIS